MHGTVSGSLADRRIRFGSRHVRRIDVPCITVIRPLDKLLELRAEAVLRLWRVLVRRSEGRWAHDFPQQTRDRHILILRALDGRTEGTSYASSLKFYSSFKAGRSIGTTILVKTRFGGSLPMAGITFVEVIVIC
nr:DUF2285 domain-containing protein [Acetobacter fabarum]